VLLKKTVKKQFLITQLGRGELLDQFGIAFNRLYTLANMPIARFGSKLVSHGKFASYMDLLRSAQTRTMSRA
jgi:hypothetical protein